MKRRMFAAIPLPDTLRHELAAYGRRSRAPEIRWTREENLHITVYFIGWVDESALTDVKEKMRGALEGAEPFTLTFDRILFAPPGKTKRMVWALFRDSKSYEKLAESVAQALGEYADGTMLKLIPHVTLARFKVPGIAKGNELREPKLTVNEFAVSRVELMESKLSPSGPTYSVVESYEII